MRKKEIDRYENAHIQVVAIEFSRMRELEPSASRTFDRLKMQNNAATVVGIRATDRSWFDVLH